MNAVQRYASYLSTLFKIVFQGAKKPTVVIEQYEMQFNYIYMKDIQSESKIDVSKTLKDCRDIELFEQESIQHIINFKWNTYTKDFFLFKLVCYCIFLVVYYIDMEMIP